MLLEQSLISTTPALGSHVHCRVHERHPCELPTTCKPASLLEMKESSWAAVITDISQGGVCLRLERRFEKGTPLAIELPNSHEDEASTVFVKVVSVQPQEGGWVLGCRFVSELADDELQRLLKLGQPNMPERKILENVYLQIRINRGSQISCVFKRFDVANRWPLTPGTVLRLNGGTDSAKWSLQIQVLQCSQEADRWGLRAQLLPKPGVNELLHMLASCCAQE